MQSVQEVNPTDINLNFLNDVDKLHEDIIMLRANVNDSIIMGNSINVSYGGETIIKQVKDRNTELKAKKEEIINDIDKKEAIIERTDRDFADVKDTLPERQPTRYINFIEDYTLAVVVLSYLFMIISVIYVYTLKIYDASPKDSHKNWIFPLLQSIIGSSFLTCFMYMMIYYFS